MKLPLSLHLTLLASVAVISASSHAAPPPPITAQSVIQKAKQLHRQAQTSAPRLNRRQLQDVDAALDDALRALLGQTNPNPYPPNPNPPYPPMPNPPNPRPRGECSIAGRGSHANYTYNYRLLLNGQSMEASDHLDTILGKLEQYRRDGICDIQRVEECSLGARGSWANYTYNFRTLLAGTAVHGTDNYDTALDVIGKLEQAGVCQLRARETCQLLPRGSWANYTYNYRVGVGAAVLLGTDNYQNATTFMQRMRTARICR